jgi:hypothetical protein
MCSQTPGLSAGGVGENLANEVGNRKIRNYTGRVINAKPKEKIALNSKKHVPKIIDDKGQFI